MPIVSAALSIEGVTDPLPPPFTIDGTITLRLAFTAGGTPVALTGVALEVSRPDGVELEVPAASMDAVSTGVWTYQQALDQGGQWRFRATGGGATTADLPVTVTGSALSPALPTGPIMVDENSLPLALPEGALLTLTRVDRAPEATELPGMKLVGVQANETKHVTWETLRDAAAEAGGADGSAAGEAAGTTAGTAAGAIAGAEAGTIAAEPFALVATTAATAAVTSEAAAVAASAEADVARDQAQAAAANGRLRYATLAVLQANLLPGADAVAEVDGDGANNGTYLKAGATGAGSWTRINTATVAALNERTLSLDMTGLSGYPAALVDPGGRIGWLLEDDGTFLAKLGVAIGLTNGLSINRSPDNRYTLNLGTVEGRLPVGENDLDATFTSSDDDALAVVDAAFKVALRVSAAGVTIGKFADRDGALLPTAADLPSVALGIENGLSLTYDSGSSLYTLNLGTEDGLLSVGTNDLDATYSNLQGDAFAVVDAAGKAALLVTADGATLGRFADPGGTPLPTAADLAAIIVDYPAGLSRSITPYGLPKRHIWGEWFLRETRQRLRARLLGDTTQLVWAQIGDSWSATVSYWSRVLVEYLSTKYGDAGFGWVGFSFSDGGAIKGNVRNNLITCVKTGTWTTSYTAGAGPDIGDVTSSTPGDSYTVASSLVQNVVDLFYIGGGGTIRYRWNAGGWTTLALSGTGLQTVALAGVPAVAWTLDIEVVSGTCVLSGLDFKRTTSGFRWHKLAANGANTLHYSSVDGATWQAGMAALAPNIVTIMHGTNDQSAYSPEVYRSNLQTIISRTRAALPYADILLVVSPENVRINSRPMSGYAAVAYEVAHDNSCAFLDLQYAFGDDPAQYADGSGRPWLDSTLIHPSSAGGRVIIDAYARLLENS